MLPYALHVHFHLHDSWMLHGAPSVNTSYWGGEIAQEWWNGLYGLSSDFERALERPPEKRLWFSYLPNTFLHIPCGWLVEHHNLPSSVCLATSMLCNWYAWHSHTMGHVGKLVPLVLVTRIVSMLTHPDSLGQLAPSHQLLSPKWNISITRKGNAQREGTYLV
jgi:hypothetical protein